jgi:hypothetical protein
VVAVLLLPDFYGPIPQDIEALLTGVVEEIVTVFDSGIVGDELTIIRVEDQEQ